MSTDPQPALPAPDADTFVDELCKRLVAGRGHAMLGDPAQGLRPHGLTALDGFAWRVIAVPELAPLARAFDRVLVRTDGFTLSVLCIQDRLRDPGRRTTATLDELRAVGADCLRYTGTSHGQKMPVQVDVWEICAEGADIGHLAGLRRSPLHDKVGVSATAIRPASMEVWTNAGLLARAGRRALVRRLVREVRAGEPLVAPARSVGMGYRWPLVTWTVLGILGAVFVLQLALGEWSGLLSPSLGSLVAFGGLTRDRVLGGEWYRLASAALMHANAVHLLMNGLALYFGGVLLEGLIGRGWLLGVFGLSALGGSAVSLLLNPPEVVSVGASGAILGLFGAALAVSFRIPYGHARTRVQTSVVQVLVLSLVPLAAVRIGGRVDFGAHLGGAVVGLLVGLLIVASWPRAEPRPRLQRLGLVVGSVAALVLAAGLAQAMAQRPAIARAQERVAALRARLAPDAAVRSLVADPDEAERAVGALLARHPGDPRLLYVAAIGALRGGDEPRAEADLRRGLEEPEVFRQFFPDGRLEAALRAELAKLLLRRGAEAEARAVLRPSCAVVRADPEARLDAAFLAGACRD